MKKLSILISILFSTAAFSASIHSFNSGDTIDSSKINDNFQATKNMHHVGSAVEIDTGEKWIDGRTIYARTFQVTASDISVSNTVLYTPGTDIMPINALRENNSGMWVLPAADYKFQAANYIYYRYDESNGNVTVQLNGMTLYVGSSFTFKYIKPSETP